MAQLAVEAYRCTCRQNPPNKKWVKGAMFKQARENVLESEEDLTRRPDKKRR
jgi:hypothetical protein